MLHWGLLCCVLVIVTSCKTLREADAAMQDWTRKNLRGDDDENKQVVERESKDAPSASAAPTDSAAPAPSAPPDPVFAAPTPSTDAGRSAAAEALFESGHEAM